MRPGGLACSCSGLFREHGARGSWRSWSTHCPARTSQCALGSCHPPVPAHAGRNPPFKSAARLARTSATPKAEAHATWRVTINKKSWIRACLLEATPPPNASRSENVLRARSIFLRHASSRGAGDPRTRILDARRRLRAGRCAAPSCRREVLELVAAAVESPEIGAFGVEGVDGRVEAQLANQLAG